MSGFMQALRVAGIAAPRIAGCSGVLLPPAQQDAAMIGRERPAFGEALKPRRRAGTASAP